ncbi:hypothetical protein PybrP1_006234 [[Pythium] brassicae (nom. inval.)]|nr:hypothetical protein PybrP1_006234 [[Pythium] brassicae (nom. inval.)]
MHAGSDGDGDDDGARSVNWRAKYQQAKDELALATYEAGRWKDKWQQEKRRRRALAKSLLDAMTLHERGRSPTDTRPSSSVFSDVDHVEGILSPTLSSFDFDDDESDGDSADSDDDERNGGGDGRRQLGHPHDSAASPVFGSVRSSVGSFPSPSGDVFRDALLVDIALEPRDSGHRVRASRSSTTGSLRESGRAPGADGAAPQSMPPQSLIYRMMYSKASARDLWQARHGPKFSTVARSIVASMHLRKERVFENFFVVGLTIGAAERAHAAKNGADGFVGFWKPRVLLQYPQGVPITECRPHQAAALNGAVVSLWTTDADRLQKHTLDASATLPAVSGAALTGAKGEILHGFCVSVLSDLAERSESQTSKPNSSGIGGDAVPAGAYTPSKPLSPRADWSRASCPAINRLSSDDSFLHQQGKLKRDTVRSTESGDDTERSLLAPVCYCFTSKFPFYRLHYTVLRLIVENEVRQRLQAANRSVESVEEYEILLRPTLALPVDFSICRRENPNVSGTNASHALPSSLGLGSIASPVHVSADNRVVISEDTTVPLSSAPPSPAHRFPSQDDIGKTGRLRKCHSSDDIGSIVTASSCIVEKPIVKHIRGLCPDEYKQVEVGDVLEAVDGIATASIGFAGAMELLNNTSDRSIRLRFLRTHAKHMQKQKPRSESVGRFLTSSSVDLLHRAHDMKIGEPGQWSTTRFPNFDVEYQSVVKILAHLLLEKQVAIMGESSARVTAVCTAFLLLLAPFQWQSTYIPVLPSSLLDFLHSPVPFLAGCHPLESTDEWPDVCFYNIDTDTITTPASTEYLDETSLPHGREFCRLLYGARERLSALRPSSKPWHELSADEDKTVTLTLQEAEIFLRDLCFDVSSFDLTPRSGQSFYDCLQEEVAKELRKSSFEEYLEEFSQTQLFCQYCESVLKPEH